MNNTNDGLVALLFVLALLVLHLPVGTRRDAWPRRRGEAVPGHHAAAVRGGLAIARNRDSIVTVAIFALVVVAAFAGFIPSGGVREIYDRTIGYQLGRTDPFSLWGLYPSLGWLKVAVEVAACALAALMFFLPPRRTLAQVAALSAALTVAVELPAQHWFYFYLVWVAPFALVAVLARERVPAAERLPAQPPVAARLEPPPPTPVAAPAG